MENYITLFNSITGKLHLFPFNEKEAEAAKTLPIYNSTSNQLVSYIYKGLMENNGVLCFTASLIYVLKSETYKINKVMGNNTFPIYVSKGNGDGFCRMCGGIQSNNEEEALKQSPHMVDIFMSMFGEKQTVRPTRNGSNYTKPKKRRK